MGKYLRFFLRKKRAWDFYFFCILILGFIGPSFQAIGGGRDSYLATLQKYRTTKTRLLGVEKTINELLINKKEAKDMEKKGLVLKQIESSYKELKEIYAEYEEIEKDLRFRYPERNDDAVRRYQVFQMRSLRQMEDDLGLDGQLDAVRDKIRKKYAVEKSELQKDSGNRAPASSGEKGSFHLKQ